MRESRTYGSGREACDETRVENAANLPHGLTCQRDDRGSPFSRSGPRAGARPFGLGGLTLVSPPTMALHAIDGTSSSGWVPRRRGLLAQLSACVRSSRQYRCQMTPRTTPLRPPGPEGNRLCCPPERCGRVSLCENAFDRLPALAADLVRRSTSQARNVTGITNLSREPIPKQIAISPPFPGTPATPLR